MTQQPGYPENTPEGEPEMFNRTPATITTATEDGPGTNPDLPDGYDDPTSRHYVPPELRDFYRVDRNRDRSRDTGKDNEVVRYWLDDLAIVAWYTAHVEAGTRGFEKGTTDLRGMRHAAGASQRIGGPTAYQSVAAVTDDDVEAWLHGYRLIDARQARQQQERTEKAEALRTANATCVICQQYDPGQVTRVTIGPWPGVVLGADTTPLLRHPAAMLPGSEPHAHPGCVKQLEVAATAAWAATTIDDQGATYADRARAYLDQHPPAATR